MKKLITVGYDLPGHSDCYHDYSSNQSLLDADIVVFEPNLNSYSLDSNEPYYKAKKCFNDNDSFRLKKDTNHWKQELTTALENGKTVFIFFKGLEESSVYTGEKQYSGTGRNARTSRIVTDYHNYKFFPAPLSKIIAGKGEEIIFKGDQIFSVLWNEFGPLMKYESYFDDQIGQQIFATKTGGKTVGTLLKVGKGNLVLLPPIVYDEKKFTKYDAKSGKEFWTSEADKFGNRLFQILLDIDKALKGQEAVTPAPQWAQEEAFTLSKEKSLEKEIEERIQKINEETVLKTDLETQLIKEIKLRDLLFEKGKPLETAIISALKILGYHADNYVDGNLEFDQVILSPEGKRYIGEAEGKDGAAISVDKFRQLATNIQEDLGREEVAEPALGILFGNGFRLMRPEERPEQFTEKCIKSAKAVNCALVRTPDLFRVAKYVKESGSIEFASSCREAIAGGMGKIVEFPNEPKADKPIAESVATL